MPKVLIIDDDPQHRALLAKILTARHFEVCLAEDGIQGLDQARINRPDLIVLDIIMPGMDGFDVAQRIRTDPVCSEIPIIVLTAFATTSAQKKAVDLGANAFLSKPLDFNELLMRIGDLIGSGNLPAVKAHSSNESRQARMISVHSLSGGLGCTSLAVNLSFAFREMWHLPTLLLDGDFSGGQITTSLNWAEGLSWSDVLRAVPKNSVPQVLADPAISFDAELHVLAGPREPTEVDLFSAQVVSQGLKQIGGTYEYVIADPAHDFRKSTLEILKSSHKILYLLASDSSSLQLARKALHAYEALGFRSADVEPILVDRRGNAEADMGEIETIIGRRLLAHVPYSAKFNVASERGLPLYKSYPTHPISTLAGDLAFLLSKQPHKDAASRAPRPAKSEPRPRAAAAAHNGNRPGVAHSVLRRMGLAH